MKRTSRRSGCLLTRMGRTNASERSRLGQQPIKLHGVVVRLRPSPPDLRDHPDSTGGAPGSRRAGLGLSGGKAVRAVLGTWIDVATPPDAAKVTALRIEYRLDLGESEAILVAETLGNVPLLMDERRGVRCARLRGMIVIRTPLIYADAKILGLISSVRDKLDQLKSHGFRLSDQHRQLILEELGEL